MGSLLRRQRPPDDGPADSKSGGVGCAVCRNKNNSNPAEDSSRPIRRSSRVAISKYSSRSSVAKRVQRRRRSRSRSCDSRRRNRSPVRKRRSRPRSYDRRRRNRSPVKTRRSRRRSCDRRRRNRSPVRKRRSRPRSCDRRRRNRSPVKKRRSRRRSCDRRRRNRSPVRKRRSRSRSYDRRRRNRSTVRQTRSSQRSALLYHLRKLNRSRIPDKHTRSISRRRKPGRPRKKPLGRPRKKPLGRPRKRSPSRPRGRPQKNTQSLVVPGSGNSLARKRDDEEERNKRERERNEKNISKREVSTKRDAKSVFKPPDKAPRPTCDRGIDDIQEDPLSSRKRRSSVVNSIPDRPFDGRKKDQSTRKISRKRQTKRRTYTRKSTKRRSYTRKRSSYKRKPRKKVSVKRKTRKPRANKNRNRNAIGSPPRFSEQEVLYMQPGPAEYCRPNETNHLSTCGRPASCPRVCLSFVCPYSRRGVETTRCLRSCRCYCCRLRNCGTGRDEAGVKSPDAWCTHCHRPIKFISKRRASASSRPRRMTRSKVSNL